MRCMKAAHFNETQVSQLSLGVGMINLWNRLNIGFRTVSDSADEMLGVTRRGRNNALANQHALWLGAATLYVVHV
jgi:hypothetical protein